MDGRDERATSYGTCLRTPSRTVIWLTILWVKAGIQGYHGRRGSRSIQPFLVLVYKWSAFSGWHRHNTIKPFRCRNPYVSIIIRGPTRFHCVPHQARKVTRAIASLDARTGQVRNRLGCIMAPGSWKNLTFGTTIVLIWRSM